MQASKSKNLLEKLVKLHNIIINLNKVDDDTQLLNHITEDCINITKSDYGSIMLIDWDKKILNILVAQGHNLDVRNKIKLKVGQGVTGMAALSGNSQLINDVAQCRFYVKINENVRSELAVPIKSYGKVIGIISVDSSNQGHFSKIDRDILTLFGQQAGRIINNVWTYNDLQMRYKYQTIILKISEYINNESNLRSMIKFILNIFQSEMGILRGFLVLPEISEKELQIVEGIGITKKEILKGRYQPGEGVIGTVFKLSQIISIPDIKKEPLFLNRLFLKRNENEKNSFIAAPIFSEKKVIGIFCIEKIYESEKVFKEDINTIKITSTLISNHIKHYLQQKKEKLLLLNENQSLRDALLKRYSFSDIIGKSSAMQEIFEKTRLISDTIAPVLITGESGTGKELLARAIHNNSSRQNKPFIAINCAAIPEMLIESELFGYKKGSFTGAMMDHPGKLNVADTGTLFLDEIGDMPVNLQAKILRVLQEHEFEPLGSHQKIKVDVRIISATNKDLEKAMENGTFRPDLYYRLNMINLHIPPLRARPSDISPLISHFIKKYNYIFNKRIKSISSEAISILFNYNWPGNIRELENAVAQSILLAKNSTISVDSLPKKVLDFKTNERAPSDNVDSVIQNNDSKLYEKTICTFEKDVLKKVMKKYKNNKSKTATALGINRNTLRQKLIKYDIFTE